MRDWTFTRILALVCSRKWTSVHSVMSDSATPWTAACQASLSFTISWSLLKLMSIESVMPSNHLVFCHPLPLLPSVFLRIRVFSNVLALCITWPKYWRIFMLSLFSHSVVSNSLRSHGLQHARLLCLSPSPGVCSNSCPLSQWCHPTISSSVAPVSSYLQSFPASGSFPVSWLFASGGQNIGASLSELVLPVNIQDWFPLGFDWFDLLAVQGTLKSLL